MRRLDLHLLPLLSRRQALAGLGATLAGACAPESDDSAAPEVTPPLPPGIDHVILVMMENRTFDHFLGSLSLLEGRVDVDGLSADMSNSDAAGTVYPPHPSEVDCLFDPPHGWSSSHSQFNGGANDGFVQAYAAQGAPEPGEVMGYMTREDLPVTYALADHYAVCDRYFASVMGPTWPNRFYGHAGTSEGLTSNDLPEELGTTLPTVWQKLEEIGLDWKYYYTDVPFLALIPDHDLVTHGGFLEDFVDDCAAGTLPPVCWVDPGFGINDDHPPHHVGMGQEFFSIVYAALATSPIWERCLLVITYDEHGGFFDHVPPPTTEDDYAADGFDQLGFRVPSIVVGPYVRNAVVSDVFDHTSWLKYVCERFGITPWNTRIAAANSIGLCLDADRLAAGTPNPPADVPLVDFPEETLGNECVGGGFGPTAPPDDATDPSAQPELRAFIGARMPHLDHTPSARAMLTRLRARLRAAHPPRP